MYRKIRIESVRLLSCSHKICYLRTPVSLLNFLSLAHLPKSLNTQSKVKCTNLQTFTWFLHNGLFSNQAWTQGGREQEALRHHAWLTPPSLFWTWKLTLHLWRVVNKHISQIANKCWYVWGTGIIFCFEIRVFSQTLGASWQSERKDIREWKRKVVLFLFLLS